MNIRVHLKSGINLEFELKNFSNMDLFHRSMDWTLETILVCGVILLINDISFIEEVKL